MAGGTENCDALAILNEQHGEGQRNNQLDLGSPSELRKGEDRVARMGPPSWGENWPLAATARHPTARVPSTGGRNLPRAGTAVRTRNATTMGAATTGFVWVEATMSVPNFRNTAATIAMTIGIGTAAMIRRTIPVAPGARTRSPEVKNAPTTSGKDKCCRASQSIPPGYGTTTQEQWFGNRLVGRLAQ